ncbi:MAG: AAA family ATPase [Aigarchaeota archaeon]|nr:AAA family ATPase [Aigarchaeota archaeon]MDW8093199.1 AAA family ATPase [Nitrososphaerota archaeon]
MSGQDSPTRVSIEEVILENFMSHTYSRVKFGAGLNVITGPNGAGKSSILLGISVALGQTYTERGERLSDLIRRGEDAARLTVILNNSPVNGVRPIKGINSDKVAITRYIKSNGEYWHYVNNKYKSKAEVEHTLRGIGLNPNNMLIIMHQNMIEQFTAKNNVEKLQMVEDAVGILQLRERILNAEAKLRTLRSEEVSVNKMMKEAEEAVEYWRGEVEKLGKLKSLQAKKEGLELEYLWSLVSQSESNISKKALQLDRLRSKVLSLTEAIDGLSMECSSLRRDLYRMLHERIPVDDVMRVVDELVNRSVKMGINEYEREVAEKEQRELVRELERLKTEYDERFKSASSKGEKIDTGRSPEEVLEELRVVTLQLASIGQVALDAESLYLLADSKFAELRRRAEELEQNVKKAEEELTRRKEIWKSKLRELISRVEPLYNEILGVIGASGRIALKNLDELTTASLELYAGFKGAEPSLLDAQTHSGGERVVATLAFLLALQNSVRSPFRAIDEFDVHLDPVNREIMVKIILEVVKRNPGTQYIVITPGLVPIVGGMNLIVVQNVAERSFVTVKEEVTA